MINIISEFIIATKANISIIKAKSSFKYSDLVAFSE